MDNFGSANNEKYRQRLIQEINEVMKRVLRKGFWGIITFDVVIQDGDIQQVEQKENKRIKITH